MKILKTIGMLALIGLGLAACSQVPAGNVGVKVYLLGSTKGVDTEELGPGRYWIGWNEDLYIFPTFTQNDTWAGEKAIAFQSKEGMDVKADIGIAYSILPSRATDVFQKYRRGVEEISDTALRNAVRDAFVKVASNKSIESVYGEGKVDMINDVTEMVRKQFAPLGIQVENVYWTGTLDLPPQVKESIDAKIAATQKAQQRQNEVQQSIAEAQKTVEVAKGEAASILAVANAQAEANRILAKSLTAELVQYKMIEKWDGRVSRVTGSSSGILLNLPDEKEPEAKPLLEDLEAK